MRQGDPVLRASVFVCVLAALGCSTTPSPPARKLVDSGSTGGRGDDATGSGSTQLFDSGSDPSDGEPLTPDAGGLEDVPIAASARSLTLVHGVTDERQRLQFCFAPIRDGTERSAASEPVPAGGIAFGGAVSVSAIRGVDLDEDGMRAYVILGDLALVAGLECDDAIALGHELETAALPLATPDAGIVREGSAQSHDADLLDGSPLDSALDGAGGARVYAAADATRVTDSAPDADAYWDAAPDAAPVPLPPLRVRALPVLPTGTLSEQRAYLLVAGGCAGGAAFTDASEESVCGSGYASDRPTLSQYFVAMSPAFETDRTGLQYLNATPALSPTTLRVEYVDTQTRRTVASDVVPGQLAPRTPSLRWRASQLGLESGAANVRVFRGGSSTASYDAPWATTLAAAGVDVLVDGHSYTLILAGPHPGFDAGRWWNRALVTLVPNVPEASR